MGALRVCHLQPAVGLDFDRLDPGRAQIALKEIDLHGVVRHHPEQAAEAAVAVTRVDRHVRPRRLLGRHMDVVAAGVDLAERAGRRLIARNDAGAATPCVGHRDHQHLAVHLGDAVEHADLVVEVRLDQGAGGQLDDVMDEVGALQLRHAVDRLANIAAMNREAPGIAADLELAGRRHEGSRGGIAILFLRLRERGAGEAEHQSGRSRELSELHSLETPLVGDR